MIFSELPRHQCRYSLEVLRRIDSHRLGSDFDRFYPIAVFEPAQLFERFGQFEYTLRQTGHGAKHIGPPSIDTYMFEIFVSFLPFAGFHITQIRDDAPTEIECISGCRNHYLRGIRIRYLLPLSERFDECSYLDIVVRECIFYLDQMFLGDKRFVALYVYNYVEPASGRAFYFGQSLGTPVRSAPVCGRGHHYPPPEVFNSLFYARIVGRHPTFGKVLRDTFVHMLHHWLPSYLSQRFAREACRSITGRYYSKKFHFGNLLKHDDCTRCILYRTNIVVFNEIPIFVTMKVDRNRLIEVFAELGHRLAEFGRDDASMRIVADAANDNAWFSPADIIMSASNIRHQMLSEAALREWCSAYPIIRSPKNVGLIMAGNIPLVGFFDMLCILISGHKLYYKPSSKDSVLTEYIASQLKSIDDELPVYKFDGERIDAIIATGSDNTNRYFRSRYGTIPSIFRGSRSSAAVLDGSETDMELTALANDIFSYSGLGCRNVSHLIVPEGYDFGRLRKALDKWEYINPKYINNFRQRSAMLDVERKSHVKGRHYILREEPDFPAYISEITWQMAESNDETMQWLAANDNRTQCIVGKVGHPRCVPFGQSQSPGLTDYPDAVDVMEFLSGL